MWGRRQQEKQNGADRAGGVPFAELGGREGDSLLQGLLSSKNLYDRNVQITGKQNTTKCISRSMHRTTDVRNLLRKLPATGHPQQKVPTTTGCVPTGTALCSHVDVKGARVTTSW